MTQEIKIKRSSTTAVPATLAQGELAYSSEASSRKLFIGQPGTGDVIPIGGAYYVDILTPTTVGTPEQDKAIIPTAGGKLNILNVDNLRLDGNSLTSTDTNGDISITPNGAGNIVLDGVNWPTADGGENQFLKTDGSGNLSWSAIPSGSFTITDGTVNDVFSTGETLTFTGGTGISTSVTNNQITFSNTGVTSFTSGTGLSVNTNATGAVSVTNTGVTSFTSGTGLSVNTNATGGVSVTNTDRGSAQNIFKAFAVSGQTSVSANANSTTLTLVAGTNISITTNNTTKAVTINAADTNTDVDVSVGNLQTRLGQISSNTTIGDATDVDITFSGDVIVTGDLTVNGTTTTVNTTELLVEDNLITLNSGETAAGVTAGSAGIEVDRGTATNTIIRWNESTDRWQFTNNGSTYYNLPISTEYTNYAGWTISDGTNSESLASGNTLTFDSNHFQYTLATNTMTIISLDGGVF